MTPSNGRLQLFVPSKGRMMDDTLARFAAAGLAIAKTGSARGYRGAIAALPGVDVQFVSFSEIARALKEGTAHLGVTGDDLAREQMSDYATRLERLLGFGFGFADVVVAVPACWLDVRTMADLDATAAAFHRAHGRWHRVASKLVNLTRRFFTEKGVGDYRIVESLGATEGAPAAGAADLIVDITSSGATLAANGLRVLDDGVIFRSETSLFASNEAAWTPEGRLLMNFIGERLRA